VREVLRSVPMLFWLALIWAGLTVWAEDIRGAYIAMACVVLGTWQLVRSSREG
jgi:hypothetical protein